MLIKVMSYNIQHCQNFISGQIDFDTIAGVIREQGADIIGLNEVRGKGCCADYEEQTEILAQKLGFYRYFAKAIMVEGKNPYGNALLSRYPIVNAETVMIPDPVPKINGQWYETRCVCKAQIDVAGGITVLVTHFGLNTDEQINAAKTVKTLLPDKKCILMGDFNVTPEAQVLTPIKAALTDTADFFTAPLLSFPSDKPVKKIDYMLVSKDITVKSADIPAVIASDHRPYTAILEII